MVTTKIASSGSFFFLPDFSFPYKYRRINKILFTLSYSGSNRVNVPICPALLVSYNYNRITFPLYLNLLGEYTTCHGLNTTIPILRTIIYIQNSHARSQGVGEFFTFFELLNNDLHSIVHSHSMILLVWII